MSLGEIERRSVLKGALVLAATGFGVSGARIASAQQVPFSTGTERPKTTAPANATDCHMHIYDKRFPAAPNATLLPPDALPDDYRKLQQRIGTTRNVVVTPSTYGTDNGCTLAGMAALGPTTRGVAVVNTSVTDVELKRLDGLGIRGIRFNLVQAGATSVEMLEPLSKRVNDLGWHVQIHMLGPKIVEIEGLLLRLPSPIVFDHLARVPQPDGVNHPAYTTVRKLIDRGRTWVKLSGAYQDTKVGPPTYADTTAVAKALAKAAPERMVWGSDWPHPTEKLDNKPDDAILFDLLAEWVPDQGIRNRILVQNPETLYGFPKST
jgi:predicted TIM-barrel fold metal-dependent hydrolase